MKPPSDEKLEAFRRWALKRYSDRSTRKLVADLRACVQYDGEPPESAQRVKRLRDYRWAWDVWQAWGGGGKVAVPRPVVPDVRKVLGGRRSREPKRVNVAVSFERKDYDELVRRAEADGTAPACVLLVIARTGLRVGDVLRTPVGALREGVKRADGVVTLVVKGEKPTVYSVRGGGLAEKAWRALLESLRAAPSGWTVAEGVMEQAGASAEAGQGAYERVRRALERLGADADVSGRLHLHRFRRSVAVYLAAAGATEAQIQSAMIHTSPATTRGYMDEARALESARLLGRIG